MMGEYGENPDAHSAGKFSQEIENYRNESISAGSGARADRWAFGVLAGIGATSVGTLLFASPGVLASLGLVGGPIALAAAGVGLKESLSNMRRSSNARDAESLLRQADMRSGEYITEGDADRLRDYVEKSHQAKNSKGFRSGAVAAGSALLAAGVGLGAAAVAGAGVVSAVILAGGALLNLVGAASVFRDTANHGRDARRQRIEAADALRGLPEGIAPPTRPGYPEEFIAYPTEGYAASRGGFVLADSPLDPSFGLSAQNGGYEAESPSAQSLPGGYAVADGVNSVDPLATSRSISPKELRPATRLGRALGGVRERRAGSAVWTSRPGGSGRTRRQSPGDQRNGGGRGAR